MRSRVTGNANPSPVQKPASPSRAAQDASSTLAATNTPDAYCRYCGRPVAETRHGWGHAVTFARLSDFDRHHARPVFVEAIA